MVIASPAGNYFGGELKPVTIWVSREYARAGKGGMGAAKTGGNYAASLLPQLQAAAKGADQVVFLDQYNDDAIEELGGMNVFFVHADGRLVTPALTGTILEGVTRSSILQLGRDMGLTVEERRVTLAEWAEGVRSGEITEVFACGTAAVVTPIGRLLDGDDVIESAGAKTGKAHVIKSHHNVGGLPEEMNLKLVEPLRELFKDEVRKIGLELGLPYDMVYRHPFPGPGLGVRILGEVKKEYADLLRRADDIFISELRNADWYHKVSQAFVVFQPVKSVGVVGDGRRYAWVVALRAVETIDFMTARWAHLPYELLEKVSNRIINEIEGISRVTYDVSSKPPATIEWE